MPEGPSDTIIISSSAVPGAAASTGRTVVIAVTSYCLGRGYIKDDTATLILVLVPLVILPWAYGIYINVTNYLKLRKVVQLPGVPDSIAKVKG